jgi:predicted nucleic acid-binding protein
LPSQIVIDTGPCVALFDRDDAHHEDALRFARRLRGELLTSRAVVTEVMYMLSFSLRSQQDFLTWIDQGLLTLREPLGFARVSELMGKYADRPMDFADAIVVALCEELGTKQIATLDDDFSIYRNKGRGAFINVFLR